MASETFRTSKLEKFIESRVDFMIQQQRVIDAMKAKGASDETVSVLEYNQNAVYNYTFDLCREFSIEMPQVPGVTP